MILIKVLGSCESPNKYLSVYIYIYIYIYISENGMNNYLYSLKLRYTVTSDMQ